MQWEGDAHGHVQIVDARQSQRGEGDDGELQDNASLEGTQGIGDTHIHGQGEHTGGRLIGMHIRDIIARSTWPMPHCHMYALLSPAEETELCTTAEI